MIFPVLLQCAARETECHEEKNNSSYFQPELVAARDEGPQGGANRAFCRTERAAAAGLLADIVPGYTRRCAQLLERRNFGHGLDFNSLGRYNDATCRSRAAGSGTHRSRVARIQSDWVAMQTASPDFVQLKSGMKAAWMAGDFGQIASFVSGEEEVSSHDWA